MIDLRLKFGLDEAGHAEQTCIIEVDVGKEIGLIGDTVREVLDVCGDSIEPPPVMGESVDSSFILGTGKVNDEVKVMLDIEQAINCEDPTLIAATVGDGRSLARTKQPSSASWSLVSGGGVLVSTYRAEIRSARQLCSSVQ